MNSISGNVEGVKPNEGLMSIRVDDIDRWFEFVKIISKSHDAQFIFRGQADAKWHIKSTLERSLISVNDGSIPPREVISDLEHFALKACRKRCEDLNIAVTTDAQLLALLQHCGCPTRLVDFTRDISIATWFAAHEERESDFAVYMIRMSEIKQFSNDEECFDAYLRDQTQFFFYPPVFVYQPRGFQCARIKNQKSLFLATADLSVCLEESLRCALDMDSLGESLQFVANNRMSSIVRLHTPLSEVRELTELLNRKIIKFTFSKDFQGVICRRLARKGYNKTFIYPPGEIDTKVISEWIKSQIQSYVGIKMLYRNWYEKYGNEYFDRLAFGWFNCSKINELKL